MKPLFIVNDEQNGTKVVSENVLTNDIRESMKKKNITSYKLCDVESLAHDVVIENAGKAIDGETYQRMLHNYVQVLTTFHEITPFIFMKDYMPQDDLLNVVPNE